MTVPAPIPTPDGRLFVDGLVVMAYVEGGAPETESDWRRVAATLRELHRLTRGWPQRPGWRSSTDLLHAENGTKIDLGAMPAEAVARCRAAWGRLAGRDTCVVHGDPNPGNIRMTAGRVAMIDWDEAHVDVPDLDLALPADAAGLGEGYDTAAQASAAWEAAVCWDDDYAQGGSPKCGPRSPPPVSSDRSPGSTRSGPSLAVGTGDPRYCVGGGARNDRRQQRPPVGQHATTPSSG